jgi:hypothetical protein
MLWKKYFKSCSLMSVFLFTSFCTTALAEIMYVDADANEFGSGFSWEEPRICT